MEAGENPIIMFGDSDNVDERYPTAVPRGKVPVLISFGDMTSYRVDRTYLTYYLTYR